jgi:hypothetical protein
MAVSLQSQVECAKRELAMRRRVYPRFIENGSMTGQKANQELAAMEAIVATLQRLRDEVMRRILKAG